MKIKYVHCSEPEVEKVYDTVVALKNNPFIHMSQEEFDKMELAHMERDANAGKILFYEKMIEAPVIASGLVVHCDTETETKMLMHIAEEQGYVWSVCREAPTTHTYFHVHQEKTCYRFEITESGNKYISYADKACYREKDFSIVEFDKFFFGISYEEMQQYGYEWEEMYALARERAVEFFDKATIYKLYDDGTEVPVDAIDEIISFEGMLGIGQDDFKRCVENLYEKEPKEEREV